MDSDPVPAVVTYPFATLTAVVRSESAYAPLSGGHVVHDDAFTVVEYVPLAHEGQEVPDL